MDAATVSRAAGQVATVTFTRLEGSDFSRRLLIAYTAAGPLLGGNGYVTLGAVKKLKPGRTSASVRVAPLPGGAEGKVKLSVAAGDGHTVAEPGRVKVKIRPPAKVKRWRRG